MCLPWTVSGAASIGLRKAIALSQASEEGAARIRARSVFMNQVAASYDGTEGHSGNLTNDAKPIYDVDRPVRVAAPDAINAEGPLMDAIEAYAGGKAVAKVGGVLLEGLEGEVAATAEDGFFEVRGTLIRCLSR